MSNLDNPPAAPEQAEPDEPVLICSAKGCHATATWAVRWNNPRIHTPERRKVWLACNDHRPHLERHLETRNFHLDTIEVGELTDADG
jgi:hypothetical protein